MATSGRDRDPAFRRKRPTSASTPTPKASSAASQKAATETSTSGAKAEPEVKTEPVKVAPTPASKESSSETKATPKGEKRERNPQETSRKSKIVGLLLALIFLIGILLLGYYIITSIMAKENSSTTIENTTIINEGADNDEGEAHAGDVSSDGSETSSEGSSENGNEKGDAMRETTLSEENNIENEIQSNGTENNETSEKKALSSVIKKKGDFVVPCWIIGFSANSKKPLANMNYSALEALGYDAGIYWIPKYFPGGKEMYKVYVGPYTSPEEAQAILPQIRNLQPDAYVMKIED